MHDQLQPLNPDATSLLMFLAKLWMTVQTVLRNLTDLMFTFQMALPCLEATNIVGGPDFSDQRVLRKTFWHSPDVS